MELDEAIGKVSSLYRAVTGRDMPPSDPPYAPIPAEKDPVQHVQEQMDRLLGLLDGGTAAAAATTWAPPITIYESPAEVVVTIDVPGTTRDNVEVHLESGMLVVSGQRAASPANGETTRHVEVRLGAFRRAVPIPAGLSTVDMTARLENGVLEVRIPRDGEGGVRQVAVS
jgi:HSP20 family protein